VPGAKCTSGPLVSVKCDADIVIQQRLRSLDMDAQRQLADRCIVIAELDDDPTDPRYTHGKPFDPMPLAAVHAVQVSTEKLAELVREFNPNVEVFPNQIAMLPPLVPKANEGINIFYGAQNRQDDWAPIMPALNRVLADHPETRVHVVHDKEFFDALEIPTDRKFFEPFCEYTQYRAILRYCDIALLPLEPGRFNECKSDIKFLECAAEGVYVIASKTVYGRTMNRSTTGYGGTHYDTPSMFELLLQDAIRAHCRPKTCEVAYAYVRYNRLLGQHYRRQLDWYRSLIHNKQDLHQQLLNRIPDLAVKQPERDLSPIPT
jgi:hypothetical protein